MIERIENKLNQSCTFFKYGKRHVVQPTFRCITCEQNGIFKKPNQEKKRFNSCCCLYCAVNEHKGHNMDSLGHVSMYCDSGDYIKEKTKLKKKFNVN